MNCDLWMSRGVDIFELIVHFFNHNLEPGHTTIGLFEIIDTSRVAMVIQMNEMLPTYGLNAKVFAYVKYESNNLTTMTTTLTSIVSYKVLRLTTPFIGSCWEACNVQMLSICNK